MRSRAPSPQDFTGTPIGQATDGTDVYLKDIWPTNDEIRAVMDANIDRGMFTSRYAQVFKGDARWQAIEVTGSDTYQWRAGSTYVANPPYFEGMSNDPRADRRHRRGARARDLRRFDHHRSHFACGQYQSGLAGRKLASGASGLESRLQFSYGARRGHHEVMMRGTFANIRIRNEMIPGIEGGMTSYKGEVMPIYDAAMRHKADGTALIVIAGKEYGTGSSRDWAAKGTNLLGVRAVITESFERIHRSNLVGMGVLPLAVRGRA